MEINRNENKYIRAKERVEELKNFYSHITAYTIVIVGLAALNYFADGWRYIWFLWVAFGWGIGIISHAISTFNLNPFFNKDWENRKIRAYIEKQEEQEKWR